MKALQMAKLERMKKSDGDGEDATESRIRDAARRATRESLAAALSARVGTREQPRITRISRLDRHRAPNS